MICGWISFLRPAAQKHAINFPSQEIALALGLAPPTGVGDHARSACETVFLAAGTEEIYEKVSA